MGDLANKIQRVTNAQFTKDTLDIDVTLTPTKRVQPRGKMDRGQLEKVVRDSERISSEEVHGLLTQVIKDRVFNGVRYVRGRTAGESEMIVED
jgi:COP9 signalosome complex subunit 5